MHPRMAVLQLAIELPGADPAGTLQRNATHAAAAIAWAAEAHPGVRLLVLPEFVLTGANVTQPASAICAITMPGPELDRVAAAAREHAVYVAGASYERDPAWPGRVWNTGFLLGPDGALLLKSRKHTPDVALGVSAVSIPADVVPDGEPLFPTVDTEIGKLAVVVGEDIRSTEIVRSLVLRGCEVVLNPSWEVNDDAAPARARSRRSRAAEELAWVLVAVQGGVSRDGEVLPGGAVGSVIIDCDAEVVAAISGSGPAIACAVIDLDRQRRARQSPFANMPAQLRTGLYTAEYGPAAGNRAAAAVGTREARIAEAKGRIEVLAERGSWLAPGAAPVRPYGVLLAQTRIRFIDDPARRDDIISENLDRSLAMITAVVRNGGPKVVVFPEYWLQGAFPSWPVADWLRISLRIPGPETDRLCEFAARYGVYLVGAAFETDAEWPGRFFNCGFIIGPAGDLLLKYRKLQCGDVGGLVPVTTPGQVFDEYVRRYGYEALWPVLETHDVGRLGVMICHDGSFPEMHRALALRGAELICYPTGDAAASRPGRWDTGSTARAADNAFWFAHVNSGGEIAMDGAPPTHFHKGHSRLVDYTGRVIVEAGGPGEVPLTGLVDIEALRAFRHDPMRNPLAWHRPEVFASTYRDFPGVPVNGFLDEPIQSLQQCIAVVAETIGRYTERGTYSRVEPAAVAGVPRNAASASR